MYTRDELKQKLFDFMDKQRSGTYSSSYDDYFRDTPYWDQYQGILKQFDVLAPSNWWSDITGQSQVNAYEHNMARNEALQALLMQMKADEYNSPEQEVQRNAAAGLNSDILGTQGVNDQAPYAPAGRTGPAALSNPIDFLSMFGSAVQGAFGIVGQIQDMQTKSLMNDKERLSIHSLLNGISLETLVNGDYSKGDADIAPAVSFGYNTGSKLLDKRLESRTKVLMDSLPHQIATYKAMGDRAGARKSLFDVVGSAGYSDDDVAYLGTLAGKMAHIQQLTLELQHLESQTNSRYQVSQDNWDMQYLQSLDAQTAADAQNVSNEIQAGVDPVAAADAINSTNETSSKVNKIRKEIFDAETGLIYELRTEAEGGNMFAAAVLLRLVNNQSTGISNAIGTAAQSAGSLAKAAKVLMK